MPRQRTVVDESAPTPHTTACVVPATHSGATGSGKPGGFACDHSTFHLYRMPDEKTWQTPCNSLAYSLGLGDAIPTGGIRFPCARFPSCDMRAWGCRFRIDAVGHGRCDGSCFAGSCGGAPLAVVKPYTRYLGLPHELPRAILHRPERRGLSHYLFNELLLADIPE